MGVNQYEIYLVGLNPTIGSEMNKTRPYVIISPNEMNNHINTVIIAPLTSTINKYPSRILIEHNNQKSMMALDQMRAVDKTRLIKKLGQLDSKEISNCKQTIKQMFVD